MAPAPTKLGIFIRINAGSPKEEETFIVGLKTHQLNDGARAAAIIIYFRIGSSFLKALAFKERENIENTARRADKKAEKALASRNKSRNLNGLFIRVRGM